MSEERETTIAILARVVERAQERYIRIGAQNVFGLTVVERAQIDNEYKRARDDLWAAQDTLRQALKEPS